MENEFELKQSRIQELLSINKIDAILLQSSGNFAWATCGGSSYINRADTKGVASLLISKTDRFIFANRIDATRLECEEGLKDQGWVFQVAPWYEQSDLVSKITKGMKLGADIGFPGAADISINVARLRSQLTPEEGLRYKNLSALCAQGMWQLLEAVHPGMTEYEIAGFLLNAVESKGVQGILVLIATDERVFSYRHPLPTSKKLNKYAMVVLCGRKDGLICSITRLIHFGSFSDELRRKEMAVAQIDAEMIAATRPGLTMGDVFRKAQEKYASTGFENEWQLLHQGGSAGYAPREFFGTPASTEPIIQGQAFAWNPSITGVKSEDTILVGGDKNEVLTEMEGWPTIDVLVSDQIIKRPAILVR